MFPNDGDRWRPPDPPPSEATQPVPTTPPWWARAEARYASLAATMLLVFVLGGLVGIGADRWISTHPLSSALPAALAPAPAPAPAQSAPAAGSASASSSSGGSGPRVGPRAGQPRANGSGGASAAAPTPGSAPAVSGTPATTAEQQAIQQVIQKGDQEQAQAIASGDPTVMQDTATPDFYQEQVRVNQDLKANGVTAIKLTNIDWGAITVNGSTASATAWETWGTTYDDGTTDQSRDRNVYTLVQDNGAWKVSADDHPDDAFPGSGGAPPGGGSTGGRRPGGQTSPSQPGQPAAPAPTRVPGGLGAGTSRNWAGYAATGGTFTAVTGTWTVPPFAADATAGSDAAWVGIGGVRSRDLIQAGTQQTVSGSGTTRYEAWVETLPRASHPVPLTVNPGDSVTVSLTQQAGTQDQWLIAFKNNTTGQTYQVTETYTSSLSSAEWIEEAPSVGFSRQTTLDHFGSISFSGDSAVKDGQTVTIAGAGARAITMAGRGGQALASPSALGADGSSFTVNQD